MHVFIYTLYQDDEAQREYFSVNITLQVQYINVTKKPYPVH